MRHRDPVVAPDAFVASSAVLVGDVRVGPAAVIDHGALRGQHRAHRCPAAGPDAGGHAAVRLPGADGSAVVTSDLDEARELLAAADFFGKVFA